MPVHIGIGLNTGICCVGNLGSETRFDYSVIGERKDYSWPGGKRLAFCTTTNIEGRVTTVSERVTPRGTSRPDWMIAAELAFTDQTQRSKQASELSQDAAIANAQAQLLRVEGAQC